MKSYHATMNSSHRTFFAKLMMQRWSNIVMQTSGRLSEFDIAVTKLYRCYHHNTHGMLRGELLFNFEQGWHVVI